MMQEDAEISFICKASYVRPTVRAKKHHFCLLLIDYFLADKFGPRLPVHESWVYNRPGMALEI